MSYFVNSKNTTNYKLVVLGSIACLVYFAALLTLSHYNVQITIAGVFGELQFHFCSCSRS